MNDVEAAVKAAIELADILFEIGPFEREEQIDHWRDLLADWLRGRAHW